MLDCFPAKNFGGILARIQDGRDIGGVMINPVINPIGKTRGKETVMIPPDRMNSGKRLNRIDIRADRRQKIPAQTLLLGFVKNHAPLEVSLC